MDKIGKILDSLVRSLGLAKKLEEGKALTLWDEAVGPEIARNSRPIRIRGSKLFVQVSSASWRSELMFLKQDIIHKLNSLAGREIINEIIFVAGL